MSNHLRIPSAVVLSLACGVLIGAARVYATTTPEATSSSKAPHATTQVTSAFSGLKVYPNPWRSDKHANQDITFAPLPGGSTIKIFTASGHWVKTLGPTVNTWNLTNDKGDKVASGVYLYVVTQANSGEKAEGKIAVIK